MSNTKKKINNLESLKSVEKWLENSEIETDVLIIASGLDVAEFVGIGSDGVEWGEDLPPNHVFILIGVPAESSDIKGFHTVKI